MHKSNFSGYEYKYRKYKQKYFKLRKIKQLGGLQAKDGNHILEITGPVSMNIFKVAQSHVLKKDDIPKRTIYNFGETHIGWNNTCYTDENICKEDKYCFSIIEFFEELIRRITEKNRVNEQQEYIDFYIEFPYTYRKKQYFEVFESGKPNPLSKIFIYFNKCIMNKDECYKFIRLHRIDYRANIEFWHDITHDSIYIKNLLRKYKYLSTHTNRQNYINEIKKVKDEIERIFDSKQINQRANIHELVNKIKKVLHFKEIFGINAEVMQYSRSDLNNILNLILLHNREKIEKQFKFTEFEHINIHSIFDKLRDINMIEFMNNFNGVMKIVTQENKIENDIKANINNLLNMKSYNELIELFDMIFKYFSSMGGIFMDLYAVGRMLRTFKESIKFKLPPQRNIVILSGNSHAKNYNNILEDIFNKKPIFSQKRSELHTETIRCIRTTHPEDILNFNIIDNRDYSITDFIKKKRQEFINEIKDLEEKIKIKDKEYISQIFEEISNLNTQTINKIYELKRGKIDLPKTLEVGLKNEQMNNQIIENQIIELNKNKADKLENYKKLYKQDPTAEKELDKFYNGISQIIIKINKLTSKKSNIFQKKISDYIDNEKQKLKTQTDELNLYEQKQEEYLTNKMLSTDMKFKFSQNLRNDLKIKKNLLTQLKSYYPNII